MKLKERSGEGVKIKFNRIVKDTKLETDSSDNLKYKSERVRDRQYSKTGSSFGLKISLPS